MQPLMHTNAQDGPKREPGTATISVVVPMFNEAPSLDAFFARVEPVVRAIAADYEIVCINDGSRDGTLAALLEHRSRNPRIKVIDLARNFGKEQALTAGLDAAMGDAVIPMDSDLQDPPELIAEFVAKWCQGFDVVYGVRRSRESDSRVKRATARLFYRLFNRLTELPIPENTGDFRLMDRRVVAALGQLPERNRFMKGLFSWVGFRQTGVDYDREARTAGRTTWNYWRLWNFALDGITGFSTVPLRLWSYAGAVVALIAFAYAAFLIVRTVVLGVDVPGYASLMVVVLFLGGVQLISLGVIGEYLGRLYHEAKQRPTYLVGRTYGLGEDD